MPVQLVLIAVASVEMVAVHLVLHAWSAVGAWVVTGLSAGFLVYLTLLTRALVRRPHLLTAERLRIRWGITGELSLPIDRIDRVEDISFAPEPAGRDLLPTTEFAHPNLLLHLDPPLHRSRAGREWIVTRVTLRVDEMERFRSSLAEHRFPRSQTHARAT